MAFTKFIRGTSALCLALSLCGPLLAGSAIAAQQQNDAEAIAVDKKQFRTALYQALPWLPEGKNLDAAQNEVFEVLRQKTGREIALPQFPRDDDLVLWQFQRYYPGGEADVDKVKSPKSLTAAERGHLYGLMTEDLLVARELLQDPNPDQQRSGLRGADSVAVNLPYLLGDAALKVKVTEAFVLPYLSVASVDASQNLSRTQLLKAACGTYLIAGETAKYSKPK